MSVAFLVCAHMSIKSETIWCTFLENVQFGFFETFYMELTNFQVPNTFIYSNIKKFSNHCWNHCDHPNVEWLKVWIGIFIKQKSKYFILEIHWKYSVVRIIIFIMIFGNIQNLFAATLIIFILFCNNKWRSNQFHQENKYLLLPPTLIT